MSANLLGELAANNGTYFLKTGSYTGKIDQIIVRGTEPITIGKILVMRDGTEVEIKDELLSMSDVVPGLRITPHNGEVFIGIDISIPNERGGLELVLAS